MDDVMQLKKETLVSVSEYTQRLVGGISEIVENFQKGREDIATRMCNDLIEGLQWLVEAIMLTKDVQEHFQVDIDFSQVNNILADIITAFENRDYVLVGDLLEYELKPVISEWDEKIGSLVACDAFQQQA